MESNITMIIDNIKVGKDYTWQYKGGKWKKKILIREVSVLFSNEVEKKAWRELIERKNVWQEEKELSDRFQYLISKSD